MGGQRHQLWQGEMFGSGIADAQQSYRTRDLQHNACVGPPIGMRCQAVLLPEFISIVWAAGAGKIFSLKCRDQECENGCSVFEHLILLNLCRTKKA